MYSSSSAASLYFISPPLKRSPVKFSTLFTTFSSPKTILNCSNSFNFKWVCPKSNNPRFNRSGYSSGGSFRVFSAFSDRKNRNFSSSWEKSSPRTRNFEKEQIFEYPSSQNDYSEPVNDSRWRKIREKDGKNSSSWEKSSSRTRNFEKEQIFEYPVSQNHDSEPFNDSRWRKNRENDGKNSNFSSSWEKSSPRTRNFEKEQIFEYPSSQNHDSEPVNDSRWRKIKENDGKSSKFSPRTRNSERNQRFEYPSSQNDDSELVSDSRWRKNKENDGRNNNFSSSWEKSAQNYFKSSPETRNLQKNQNFEDSSSENNDSEQNNDSRWRKIKENYKFERPEVKRWNRQENWGRNTFKQVTESSIPKLVGESLYGVNPILAALTSQRREFYTLYLQEGMDLSEKNKKKKDKKSIQKIINMAEEIGLSIKHASKHDLNMISDNRPHQGLILDASPLEMVMIRELEMREKGEREKVWVALDEVMDPQNLGAIIRSAYFFGVEGVVLCAKNSAPLSGVVSKASAGSLEMIELRSCKNMMQFLASSAENGWRVLGGSVSPNAVPLSDVRSGMNTVLVLGSEGVGLRPLVERSCTDLVRICGGDDDDGHDDDDDGRDGKHFMAVESLNVSVAAGVLLYHLTGLSGRVANGS